MPNKIFYPSVMLFIVSILCVTLISLRGVPSVRSMNLKNLPDMVDTFSATEDSFSQAVYDELNADFNLYRHYRSPSGRQVDLYIGYYGTAKGGRTPHNPYGCLPSSGWAIVDTKRMPITTATYSVKPVVNYILSKKQNEYSVMLYWYQSAGDKVLATGFQQNIQRLMWKVMYNRNDGAFVRVSISASEDNLEENIKVVSSFAGKILDLLPLYWPVETIE